jgi:hypothetical protein
MAMTLCCVNVRIGSPVSGYAPKKVVGTNARNREMAQTTRKERHLFKFIGCPRNEK